VPSLHQILADETRAAGDQNALHPNLCVVWQGRANSAGQSGTFVREIAISLAQSDT
jgi:hypothetical protein